jgi:OPA family sugar phosphate sensor protein UhpC-like MFS transporter
MVDGVRHYDFRLPVLFWIGASILSMLLAASLWKVQVKD